MTSGSGQHTFRWIVSLLVIGSGAIWAFWPMENRQVPVVLASRPVSDTPIQLTFDQAAFSTPIWYTPPPEPEPETVIVETPRIVPPFELELIAIIDMAGQPTAVFYDPVRDVIIEVAPGESLSADRSVESIEGVTVVVRETTGLRTIELARGEP